MKVILFMLAAGSLLGGLSGCATPDAPTQTIETKQGIKPHLLPEQVTRIAKERATEQKVNLSDFNMAPPQLDQRAGKLIWSVLFTPKTDGLVGANFYIEIDDVSRESTYHGERG